MLNIFVMTRSLASICPQSDSHSSWIYIEYWSHYETETSSLPWSMFLPISLDECHSSSVSQVGSTQSRLFAVPLFPPRILPSPLCAPPRPHSRSPKPIQTYQFCQ